MLAIVLCFLRGKIPAQSFTGDKWGSTEHGCMFENLENVLNAVPCKTLRYLGMIKSTR